MIHKDTTINFSKSLFGKYFLYIVLILCLFLILGNYFELYEISELKNIFISMTIIVCLIFGTGLLFIGYGEKEIQGEAHIERYGKRKIIINKISKKGIMFIFIFGGIIPISLILLPYILVRDIPYEILFIYIPIVFSLWFSLSIFLKGK